MSRNFSDQTKKIISFLRLIRIHRPIPILLLIFPGFIVLLAEIFSQIKSGGVVSLGWAAILSTKLFLGGFAVRSIGCIFNDFFDQKIDSNSQRGNMRPFASGQINYRDGVFIFGSFFLTILALALMFSLKIPSILLCILAGILTIIYPLTKRFLSVPQVFLGITYAMPVLIIGFEVSSSFKIGHFVFYLGNAFFIFAYDSIYAIQDKNDDLENQMNSSVIKFGHSLSLIISKAYNIAFILFAAFGFLETLFFGFYVSIIFSFIFIKKIIKNLDKKENQELQKIFELNLIPLGIIIFGLIIDIYFFSFFR